MSIYAGLYRCIPFGDLIWYDINGNNQQDPNENGVNGIRVDIFKRVNNTFVREQSTYSGHRPGTNSDDGYWKVCLPPGEYYAKYNVPGNLNAVIPLVGGSEFDSNVTDAFGRNTTNAFVLESCTERCDIDAGFSQQGGLVANDDILVSSLHAETDLEATGKVEFSYVSLIWETSSLTSGYFDIHRVVDNEEDQLIGRVYSCLLYTSPSPRDKRQSRMPSSA